MRSSIAIKVSCLNRLNNLPVGPDARDGTAAELDIPGTDEVHGAPQIGLSLREVPPLRRRQPVRTLETQILDFDVMHPCPLGDVAAELDQGFGDGRLHLERREALTG